MRKLLWLAVLLPSVALAQGVRYENHPAMKSRADGALVATSATIAVCTQPANTSGQPCSPLATLYTDATLSTPCTGTLKDGSVAGATNCSNPLVTDSKGNYHFYASGSVYTIQVYGSGLVTSVEPDVGIAGSLAPNVTINGAITGTTINNVIHVDGNTGRTLAQGLALCSNGCSIVVDGPETFTTPIVTALLDLQIVCLTPGDVNSNTSGTTLTYTPAGTGTDAITFNGTSRVVWYGCNLTQGNSQANTRGMIWNGVQGGTIDFAQVWGFTSRQWVMSDASGSSAEYNSCRNSHFIGNSATGGFAFEMIQANAGKAVNQNHFANCAFKGGFTGNAIGQAIKISSSSNGSVSENLFAPVDVSGDGSPLVDMTGMGTSACRNNVFWPATIEGQGGTVANNQIGWAIGPCQMVQIQTEGGLTGPGTPVLVTRTTGTYNLVSGSSVGPGGIKWEVIYPSFQIDKDGNMALGTGINVLAGTPPSINATGGAALCSGSCGFQWGSQGAIITANHGLDYGEGTAPAGSAGNDRTYADSTLHGKMVNPNNTGWVPMGSKAILTADWTCGTSGTVASCVAATIIGSGGGVPWTFNLPLVANSLQLDCDGVVGQATAATANQWNLLTATNGATNVTATYDMYTAATAKAGGAVTDQASTTTTFQIAPSWTLGGTATKMPFHIHAAIEGASASGTVLSVQLVAPTVGDLVTIYRGSGCWIHP